MSERGSHFMRKAQAIEEHAIRGRLIEQLYQKAENTLEEPISMEDFVDLYGEASVQRDETYVREREEVFRREQDPDRAKAQRLATIFEVIFHEQVELNEWLGSAVMTIKASRYDDIKNGVDSIAEFQENETTASHLALAIDVTMSTTMGTKFARIQDEIRRGELAKIKYFHSEHLNFRGELSQIPRVVIGASPETILALGELWANKENKALANHWIQFQLLEEILLQLTAFERYATAVNQPKIAEQYRKLSTFIKGIAEQKRAQLQSVKNANQRDAAFRAVENHVQQLFPSNSDAPSRAA